MRDPGTVRSLRNICSKICPAAVFVVATYIGLTASPVYNQSRPSQQEEPALGPVVTAYLGYLRNEQEVVDDRVSRREISRAYYRRNSNRIRALREIAIRIARETGNDYLPELEAVTSDELGTLFERPPNVSTLPVGKILDNKFRLIGSVRAGEVFYVFARLDPFEQAELKQKAGDATEAPPRSTKPVQNATRPRRAISP